MIKHLGKLYLVPAPLDFGCEVQSPIADVLPRATLQAAAQIKFWICENAKSTRAVLKRIAEVAPLSCSLQEMQIVELPREVHKKGDHQQSVIPAKAGIHGSHAVDPLQVIWDRALGGASIGLMSEAGMPAIADPGSSVVRKAHTLGMDVVPLVGPVSLMLALAASGASGQSFAFHGYLPTDSAERIKRLQALQDAAVRSSQAQIFIETPYRNMAIIKDCLAGLKPATRLSVSVSLTMPNARTKSMSVEQWRSFDYTTWLGGKEPAVFVIG